MKKPEDPIEQCNTCRRFDYWGDGVMRGSFEKCLKGNELFTPNCQGWSAQKREKMKPQEICNDWNAKYPIGTLVKVHRDNGEILSTSTRPRAQLLSRRGVSVIWVRNVAGCYTLDRVVPHLVV